MPGVLSGADEKVTPAPHYLTFVNEFFRYDRQQRIGKIEHFDLGLFRREIEPMIRRLIDLCGPEWISKLCSGKASSADLGQPTVRSRCWIKWAAPRLFAKYWEERKAPPTPVRPADDCCVARAAICACWARELPSRAKLDDVSRLLQRTFVRITVVKKTASDAERMPSPGGELQNR
jgi:hypothetical protein